MYAYQRAVGGAFRSALASELKARFGFDYRAAGKGQWEIAGVPEAMLAVFSKRSAQIEVRAGPDASPAQREIAALATRRAKETVPTGQELETRWRHELTAFGLDPWAAARTPERAPARCPVSDRELALDPPEVPGDGPVARAASALLRHESVITRKDLLQRGLEEAGLLGIGVDAVEAELTALERDGELTRLAKDALMRGSTAAWTTPGIAACEAALLRSANRLDEREWLAPEAVEVALRQAPHLSDEQAAAVRHAGNCDGVAIIEAGAGTGKTTAAQAVVAAARLSELRVVGLAPSWVAAEELSASAGIPAQAIARWRHDRTHGRGAHLDARTMILVDEAGMVGSRDMEAMLSAARQAGAKVLLVGDRRQLAAVAGASPLRAVSEVVERAAAMEAVRRQTVDWQRAASVLMARGDSESGLRAYAVRGQVEFVSGEQAAQERVIAVWREQRAQYGEDVLIVTRRNREAAALNAMAREVLRAEGALGPDLAAMSSLDRRGEAVALTLAVGDRLRFGESLPHLSIRNGNRATVEAITTEENGDMSVALRLEDGRVIAERWQRFAREPRYGRKPSPPRVTHATAGTVYAAQGKTAQAAVLAITAPTDAREIYVGLTRHRHAVHVVVERERLDALCRQRQADPRVPPTTVAVLERLYKEARQYSEKANVSDYAEDRVVFAQTGRLTATRSQDRLGLGRAIRAARAMRAALRRLSPDRLIVPIRWVRNAGLDRGAQERGTKPTRTTSLVQRMRKNLDRPQQDLRPAGRVVGYER